jgi:SAM-dependent methyltransferase
LIKTKYPLSTLSIFDFYDPAKHTEISVKRARKYYPAHRDTQRMETFCLPVPDDSADVIFLILSAHEIRSEDERVIFFKELHRAIKESGKICVTEHLRNLPNFLAYNIGAFHFLSKKSWCRTFKMSCLAVDEQIRTTPFITTFILKK